MWPGFDSRTRRHMWVEFVVSSCPCSEGFSPGTPVFLPPQKLTFLNSNSIWCRAPFKLALLNWMPLDKYWIYIFFLCRFICWISSVLRTYTVLWSPLFLLLLYSLQTEEIVQLGKKPLFCVKIIFCRINSRILLCWPNWWYMYVAHKTNWDKSLPLTL